jgi:hypothetical protein
MGSLKKPILLYSTVCKRQFFLLPVRNEKLYILEIKRVSLFCTAEKLVKKNLRNQQGSPHFGILSFLALPYVEKSRIENSQDLSSLNKIIQSSKIFIKGYT